MSMDEAARQKAMKEIEEEHKKRADHLEGCVRSLQAHIRALRGEEVDMTGRGLWSIFLTNLERAAGVKVITQAQYDAAFGKQP